MSQYYGAEKTKCPFYKDETKNSIKCEGLFSVTTNQNFENSTLKKTHKKYFCNFDYKSCKHFKQCQNKSK